MSVLISVLTSGVVAALVTFAANWWLLRPRAALRMVLGSATKEDLDRIHRAGTSIRQEERVREPGGYVRLTNYGDGTAYDIKLDGTHCRPRVWIDDTGTGEPPYVAGEPMWDWKLAALPAGESVHLMLMCVPDEYKHAQVTASWLDMPGRCRSRRRSTRYAVKDQLGIETGWPGKNPEL